MIKNKLFKGIPFFIALGLMMTPAVTAYAESYGTGLTRGIQQEEEIDPGFMIKPQVFVNNKELNVNEVKILNNVAALPVETISQSMGDILEGTQEEAYSLRKADRMIVIMPSENKYILNGVENKCDFTIVGDKTYAPYTFFDTVMAYNMTYEGNSIIMSNGGNTGSNNELVEDGSALDNMMVNPEVYINGNKYPDFGLKIQSGQVYLPLDVVAEKMGDRLEGDIDTEYYLRKNNMMLTVNHNEGKYYLNGEENNLNMTINNGHVYVPVSFLSDILQYKTEINGNSILIGAEKEKIQINNTYEDGKWNKENGVWYYYINGNTRATGWVAHNNTWYFMNSQGQMQTGWVKYNNKWYFLAEDGAMQTGWIESNGVNYYLNENGDMAYDTVVDGYKLAQNGVAIALY